MTLRYYSNSASTTLAAATTYVATTIQVASTTGFPILYPYTAILGRGTASEEVVLVTAGSGTTLTVTRGFDNTPNFEHDLGTTVEQGISAIDPREANLHVNSVSNVHGVGTPVGTTEAQTLSGKTIGVVGNIINGMTPLAVPVTDNTGRLSSGGKTAPAGEIVGTSDIQTLTNKTLTSPTVNGGTFNTVTLNGPTIPNANLTGTPTVPTASAGTNSTQAASTAFVASALTTAVPGGSLPSGYFQIGGLLVQWGTRNISASNATFATATVTFPRSFSAAPSVTATQAGSSVWFAYQPSPAGTTSASLGIRVYNDVAGSVTLGVNWIAIGPA